MLSYIELINFKSFNQIKLDLRGPHGIPKKLAFIYGENGSGKSNLMSSILFLSRSLDTLLNQEKIRSMNDSNFSDNFLEVKDDDKFQDFLKEFLSIQFSTLEPIIREYKSLQNSKPMSIEFGYYLNNRTGTYRMDFDSERIIYEELKYQLEERSGTYFRIMEDDVYLSPTIFNGNDYKNELITNIEKFWGKHTFVSILINELVEKNSKYIKKRIHKNLRRVLNWLNSLSVLCKFNNSQEAKVALRYKFLRTLDKGVISNSNNKELKAFEYALNTFFTQLYSDVKGVYYKISKSEDNYEYELIFKKQIYNKIVEVPFSLESSGTHQLLEIFPFILSAVMGESVFVDEIDSGIHDLLMCNIIEFLDDSIKGQFIATTHNTLLMRDLPKENVFIIQSDANGNKDIECINNYAFRTQKTNNIQNKYLDGDYEGIPYIGYLDFEEIVDEIKEKLSIEREEKQEDDILL